MGGYAFRFEGVSEQRGPNYVAARATLVVTRDGAAGHRAVAREAHLHREPHADDRGRDRPALHARPLRRRWASRSAPMAWSVRLHYKPFVGWIWGGCLLMALGGLLAVLRPPLSGRAARTAAPGRRAVAHGGCMPAPRACTEGATTMKRFTLPLLCFGVLIASGRRPDAATRRRCRRR